MSVRDDVVFCASSLAVAVNDGGCSEVHGDDSDDEPGVGDDDGGSGEVDRLGGPRISPPRLPMSYASSSGESGVACADGV